jgi:hypothetical protein
MSPKHEIDNILTSQDYGISKTKGIGGILARLYRQILMDLQVRPNRFNLLLKEASDNAKQTITDKSVSKYFTAGNLRRELEKPEMTFKVFMKGVRLLKVVNFKICLELTFASGKKTIHSTDVNLGSVQEDIFDEDIASNYESK